MRVLFPAAINGFMPISFRLLPIHPADRHLLALHWDNNLYIDTCLPFGLRSAPKLFNTLADLLTWMLRSQGVSSVIHYLDDFLTMGPAHLNKCQDNLTIIQQLCSDLGVPLAQEKLEGPTHCLTDTDQIRAASMVKET